MGGRGVRIRRGVVYRATRGCCTAASRAKRPSTGLFVVGRSNILHPFPFPPPVILPILLSPKCSRNLSGTRPKTPVSRSSAFTAAIDRSTDRFTWIPVDGLAESRRDPVGSRARAHAATRDFFHPRRTRYTLLFRCLIRLATRSRDSEEIRSRISTQWHNATINLRVCEFSQSTITNCTCNAMSWTRTILHSSFIERSLILIRH